jgi:hypothetical protein
VAVVAQIKNETYELMTTAISIVLVLILLTAPVAAQQTTGNQPKGASDRAGATAVELTFENLLSEDSYKLYGEVHNVGQLLNATGDLIETHDEAWCCTEGIKATRQVPECERRVSCLFAFDVCRLAGAKRNTGYICRGEVGISWLHRWMLALGKEIDYRDDPDPQRFIMELSRAK